MRQSVYHERPDMSYSTIGPTAETFDYTIYQTRYPDGNSQILAQHDGSFNATRYFYLHDRLGSVRQVIDTMGNVVNHYTYRPFGELYPSPDFEETVNNPFKFTGQFYDFEINEYYLRARMYDPHIGRFTARDPVRGKFKEPLTLHRYLYCLNNPINRVDISGEESYLEVLGGSSLRGAIMGMICGGTRGAARPDATLGTILKGAGIGAISGGIAGGVSGSFAFLSNQGFIAGWASGAVAKAGNFLGGGTGASINSILMDLSEGEREKLIANALAAFGIGSILGTIMPKDAGKAVVGANLPAGLPAAAYNQAIDYGSPYGMALVSAIAEFVSDLFFR
jgi:RHS repeat-associated protein